MAGRIASRRYSAILAGQERKRIAEFKIGRVAYYVELVRLPWSDCFDEVGVEISRMGTDDLTGGSMVSVHTKQIIRPKS